MVVKVTQEGSMVVKVTPEGEEGHTHPWGRRAQRGAHRPRWRRRRAPAAAAAAAADEGPRWSPRSSVRADLTANLTADSTADLTSLRTVSRAGRANHCGWCLPNRCGWCPSNRCGWSPSNRCGLASRRGRQRRRRRRRRHRSRPRWPGHSATRSTTACPPEGARLLTTGILTTGVTSGRGRARPLTTPTGQRHTGSGRLVHATSVRFDHWF